jgi:hypothetical protein
MSSSPQRLSGPTFFRDANGQSTTRSSHRFEQLYTTCQLCWKTVDGWRKAGRSMWIRLVEALDQIVLASALIGLSRIPAKWDALCPVLLSKAWALLPFLPFASAEQKDEEPDPVWELLEDFESLEVDQQDKAAKNLALLWGHFEASFGGLTGYLGSAETEQLLYLEKLKAASNRMRLAHGTDGAVHYVTVALMHQYVGGFQESRSDEAAMTLATWVSGLIDRGRRLAVEMSSVSNGARAT